MTKLTAINLSSGVTPNDLIHIVNTGDTTQSIDGSSYKATLGQIASIFEFTGGSSNCITDLYVTNVHGCSPITIHDSVQSNGSSSTGLTSFAFGNNVTAIGEYSHAEGRETQTGFIYFRGDYVSGSTGNCKYILDSIHDNVSTYFNNGDRLYIDVGGDIYKETIFVSASTYSSSTYPNRTIITINSNPNLPDFNDISVSNLTVKLPFSLINSNDAYFNNSNYSHAEGGESITIGSGSHAEGYGTITIGGASHAEGRETISKGTYSHAEGIFTTAIGSASHAEGVQTTAESNYSHAEGGSTFAYGYGSHAEGASTTAFGSDSHSEGYKSIAIGTSSHSEGGYRDVNSLIEFSGGTAMGNGSHAEGIETITVGVGSHTEGRETIAGLIYFRGEYISGSTGNCKIILKAAYVPPYGFTDYGDVSSYFQPNDYLWFQHFDPNIERKILTNQIQVLSCIYSAATDVTIITIQSDPNLPDFIGIGNDIRVSNLTKILPPSLIDSNNAEPAYGESSHAEGYKTLAYGGYSHAEGNTTLAYGPYSRAEGAGTTSLGGYSHAEGYETIAEFASHAEGRGTSSFGAFSHTEGSGTTTIGAYSHAEGGNTTTTGFPYSHAEGQSTFTYGQASHSEGWNSIAYGAGSHTEGYFTTAGLIYVDSVDYVSGSTGNCKFILDTGNGDLTSYFNSGNYLYINDINSSNIFGVSMYDIILRVSACTFSSSTYPNRTIITIQGNPNKPSTNNIILSNLTKPFLITLTSTNNANSTFPGFAHTEGFKTIAISEASHTEGMYTHAIGGNSHAEGLLTVSIGSFSHAEGIETRSYGDGSHAEGRGTSSIGDYSHAEGGYTTSIGEYSHVGGYYNSASSSYTGIFAGSGNTITGNSESSVIVGGIDNSIRGLPLFTANYVSIIGGEKNSIWYTNWSTIVGGYNNKIRNSCSFFSYEFIIGGLYNYTTCSNGGGIIGGSGNTVDTSDYSGIFVGTGNSITNSSDLSSIISGGKNRISGSISASILGGSGNTMTISDNTVIIGGSGNTVNNSDNSTIIGGNKNIIKNYSESSVIVGGKSNTISGHTNAFIGGGQNNLIDFSCVSVFTGYTNESIIGGYSNKIYESYNSSIIGGSGNTVTNSNFGGGFNNLFGGVDNLITNGISSSIIGGKLNSIGVLNCTNIFSTIIGGSGNTLTHFTTGISTIIGGIGNDSKSEYTTIIGNNNSKIDLDSDYSSLIGGSDNGISGSSYSIIAGGKENKIICDPYFEGIYNAILGGDKNIINKSSKNSVIIGGNENVIDENVEWSVILGGVRITATSSNSVYIPLNNVVDLQINADGKFIDAISDIRLKDNIENINNVLEKVKQLRPVTFNYKPEVKLGDNKHYGLIAQEVENIFPDLVKQRSGDEEHLNVNYNEIIPLLIESIKEMSKTIEDLKEEIIILKNK